MKKMLKCILELKPEGLDVRTNGEDLNPDAFLSVCKEMMKKFPKAKKIAITLEGLFLHHIIHGLEYYMMVKKCSRVKIIK